MGKVWMPGGGGGTDLDAVTAGKPDVLAGKVIVDKDGEPSAGTMPNRGGVNPVLNAGESYSIPDGYHNGSGKVMANSLASQTSATATAAHILSGQTAWVNGSKVSGGIPWQNAEIAGTDHMWAQNYSNWGDGNYFLGVKNGYYLNGVNWVRGYNANFVAGNIKKGVNIGGVVGDWEGYVANPTDWYYFGSNPAGFTPYNANSVFESNQIKVNMYSGGGSARVNLVATNAYNLTGYTNLAIAVNTGGARKISITLTISGFSGTIGLFTGNTIVYIPLISANVTGVPTISVSHDGTGATTTYITRIWLT